MIYKFECPQSIETNIQFEYEEDGNFLYVFSEDKHISQSVQVRLTKKDVFKLIGALHCIQKDMK